MENIGLLEKQCSGCKKYKYLTEFRNETTKTCNSCYEYNTNHRRKNKDQYKKARQKYMENNPERYGILQKKAKKKYELKYPERRKGNKNMIQKIWRDELHDLYIKNQIYNRTGIPADKIPPEFIEYKRLQIQLKRKIYSYGRSEKGI